jgi:hypothetical protein
VVPFNPLSQFCKIITLEKRYTMNKFKVAFKCPESYKEKFNDSRCLLAISVGQQYHEGEKFAATIAAVNKAFKSCVILVGDTLQRHTLSLREEKTADELFSVALKTGDEWLERNKASYNKLSIPFEIVRWNYFLFHEKFAEQKELLLEAKRNNEDYANAFLETSAAFITRYLNRCEKKLAAETLEKITFDYLLEECTALCLWMELGCHFYIYPSPRNKTMNKTHDFFINELCPSLLLPVSLDFRKKKR